MPLLVLRFHSGNRTALFMEREQGKNDIAANQREAETAFEKGGYISRLSIPDNELRQCRDELLKERFGKGIRMLGTDERLLLGKLLKRKYNCSTKQISRMVSLAYSQIKDLL